MSVGTAPRHAWHTPGTDTRLASGSRRYLGLGRAGGAGLRWVVVKIRACPLHPYGARLCSSRLLCVAQDGALMEVKGGQRGGSGAGVGGRKRGGAGGVRGMSDRWVALDVA